MTLRTGRRGGLALASVAVLGAVLLGVGLADQQSDAPVLPTGGVGALDTATPEPSPSPTEKSTSANDGAPIVEPAAETPLGPSEPVSISIPSIDVRSVVFPIGLAPDGSLAVPQPGPRLDQAAWFDASPTPGQPGPSIIEGHVATAEGGPSVFFDLARLRPGDEIVVDRKDGRVLTFKVTALRSFDKDEFPTNLVYGGDLGTPTLRLITCTDFDEGTGSHTGNLVLFSELTDVSKP